MRPMFKGSITIISLLIIIILFTSPVLSLSAASTFVRAIAPPGISNLEIIQDSGIECSWLIEDFNEDGHYFSDIIWMKNKEFYSQEQISCTDCQSKIIPDSPAGEWVCMVHVYDSNGLETTDQASITISPPSIATGYASTGYVSLDDGGIFDFLTNIGEVVSDIVDFISGITDLFS
jgi:hypothetical protein